MRKYLLKRILFSLFALLVVTGTVIFLTYNLMNRDLIFATDPDYTKVKLNEREMYKHDRFADYGYEEYFTYSAYVTEVYQEKYGDDYKEHPDYKAAVDAIDHEKTYLDNKDVQDFIAMYEAKHYTIEYYAPVYKNGYIQSYPYLIAVHEYNLFERIWALFSNIITFETKNDIKDYSGERYVRWEWDERSNMPALVGSGTQHKYLIYFDDKFPFIHQNIIHLNLGKSFVDYRGIEMVDVLNMNTGKIANQEQEYPVDIGTGVTHDTAIDFHSVTYSPTQGEFEKSIFGENDKYTSFTYFSDGLTRIGNSFVIGIFAVILTYLFGLPLGIWMARRKDKLVDKLGNIYIIFIMAVPSLAYIFTFAAIGVSMGLPFKWNDNPSFWISIILPVLSLALPAMGGLMKWMRRYMIDQSNADYVKFARSTGMTEREIFSNHISKNAFIYIIHSVPADILFALVGALITERVYAIPGVGGLLTNAITNYDNGIIVAGTIFYSTLTILALILGDLLLAKYDPRVSFTNERG